jgi:hypothetical protein
MVAASERTLIDRLASRMLEQHGARAVAVAEMLASMATPQGGATWAEVVEALRQKLKEVDPGVPR